MQSQLNPVTNILYIWGQLDGDGPKAQLACEPKNSALPQAPERQPSYPDRHGLRILPW